VIQDPEWQRKIVIEKEGSRTTVVWNPWAKLSADMIDLGPDAYRRYVCVETVVGPQEHKRLEAGETHELTAHIRLEA
jgi:glucose-6-phosphate 1-epimerase